MSNSIVIKEKEFIFISNSAIIGGIETLMVRMVNQLEKSGWAVTVISPAGPIVRSLNAGVRWVKAEKVSNCFELVQFCAPSIKSGCIHIWVSHPYLLPSVYKLQKIFYKVHNLRSVAKSGVFIPAEIVETGFIPWVENYLVLRLPPKGSVYFMSDVVRESFVRVFGNRFSDFPIHRLPVSDADKHWMGNNSSAISVVSVGRLTGFKAYNFGASDIVRHLREKGVDCVWNIWGEGEELEAAISYAKSVGVEDYVIFRGQLNYESLSSEICKHSIFVGMGTAVLESALCGIPSVVALANSREQSAGYLFDAPSDSIGENSVGVKRKSIEEIIYEFSRMTHGERIAVGLKCRSAALAKSSVGEIGVMETLNSCLCYPSGLSVALRMEFYLFLGYILRVLRIVLRRER